MRRITGLAGVVLFSVLLAATDVGAQPGPAFSRNPDESASEPLLEPGEPTFASDRIIVKMREGASADALDALNRQNNARVQRKLPRAKASVVKLPRGLQVREAVRRYEASPGVEYAEPDFVYYPTQEASPVTPNDPEYRKQDSLNNVGQYVGGVPDADVDAPEAWGSTTGGADAVVAVIDTGVDVNHPDLKDNVWTNPDEVAGNGVDDDNNKYVDDVHGWDFVNNDNTVEDPLGYPSSGHGTHVAGTIAAEGNNGLGVTGINWQAKVMPLKYWDTSKGYGSGIVEALDYSLAEGVRISNNSYGCFGCYSQLFSDAIERAGFADHLFVAAAGNGGDDGVGDDNDATPHYPSSYDLPNVVGVAAVSRDDKLTGFSNYGATSVDLAAPGDGIYSTMPDGGYGFKSGTSMATPHATGVAALLKSADSTLDYTEIKDRILRSADAKPALAGKTVSGGRLNAANALDTVAPLTSVPRETLIAASTLGDTTIPTTIAWSGSDARSGVDHYELQQSVGGGAFSDVPLPSPLSASVTRNLAPNVSQQFRVRAVDNMGNVGAWSTGPVFTDLARQESSGYVTYPAGTWTPQSSTAWYGGTTKYASASGARAVYKFTGSEVTWVGAKYLNRGRAEVWLDGVKVATVDTYASSIQPRKVLFKKDWGTRGTHTMEIRALGTKNASSSGTRVDVDAFVNVY